VGWEGKRRKAWVGGNCLLISDVFVGLDKRKEGKGVGELCADSRFG